jgi:hypothetical protein
MGSFPYMIISCFVSNGMMSSCLLTCVQFTIGGVIFEPLMCNLVLHLFWFHYCNIIHPFIEIPVLYNTYTCLRCFSFLYYWDL